MEEYKPNSNKYKKEQKEKEQERKVEKVVTGKVITKKRSGISRFFGEFIKESARDVLVPVIKDAILDIGQNALEVAIYGGSKPGHRRSTADRISYNSYSKPGSRYRDERPSIGYNAYSLDDIILETRGEAEDVLDRMYELLDTYQIVRVADLYDLVGKSGNYTDNKYGWTSLHNADIVRVRGGGYMIKMPRAIPID